MFRYPTLFVPSTVQLDSVPLDGVPRASPEYTISQSLTAVLNWAFVPVIPTIDV